MTIAARLGQEQANRLSAILGGTQVVIPCTITGSAFNAGSLRAKVGDTLFVLLVFHFGGSRLYVPQLDEARRSGHDPVDIRRIDRLTKRGWSAARIARDMGCSTRTIYKRRKQLQNGRTPA